MVYSLLFGQEFIVTLSNMGYDGRYPLLMLSAHAELEASGHNMEFFNWSRVSVSDPRILTSMFLQPPRGK
jgi:hypothetical protein